MKLVSETTGIERLRAIRREFAEEIRNSYEHRAKPCSACETPGICCRDEHFVNVRITRLEAAAIVGRLNQLDERERSTVFERVRGVIEKYELAGSGEAAGKTYACPLFEKGAGCLVHDSAKPLPCIAHACYENRTDMPPGELLEDRELRVADLNRRVYGALPSLTPLPVAIAARLGTLTARPESAAQNGYGDQKEQE